MQAKRKVLVRFPDAKLVETAPFHWSIQSGDKVLDYTPSGTWQGKTAAWRIAYYWGVRNPQETLVLPVDGLPEGEGWTLETGNAFQNKWVRG